MPDQPKPRTRWRPTRCRADRNHPGPISARGWCPACQIERQTFAARELHAHDGPNFEKWRAGMKRHAQRVLDEL